MRRPEGVSMIAMWFFLSAGFCVLGLGGMAIGFMGLWSGGDIEGILFGTMGMVLGVIAISATGITYSVVGWGLWTLKPWARSAAIIMAALQILVIPFGTVAAIMTLIYLNRNREAKAAFGIA